MDGSDQLGSAVTLGIVLAVGVVLVLLLIWLVRAVWRWMMGDTRSAKKAQKQEPVADPVKPIGSAGVTASDLFVVRSNLNAIARQVEDLERRLRLEGGARTKEMAATRD
ncbi:hypothetical protein HPT29_015645 [Microvirga terrae]|uniref:Uncharacterized protein n=1 Tax=Microvirga terrae TaxID=2740529 RepID=A0ABY5RPM0_9HYPH|nr:MULTISPECIES: hypothetical protein [Microvirga]MBQ0823834.1 hypothetical protein [Microvirga sp. HBU67558]UVF17949.1 hypothetical protein HPT29_015645 [Microvirga terrae]